MSRRPVFLQKTKQEDLPNFFKVKQQTNEEMKNETSLEGVNTNLSYFTLRKIIGWSGVILPWAVWLLSWSYQPSISDYYYTRSGVLFTSVLTLMGVFLISYRGYEEEGEKLTDNVITWIGGILILIVAAIPTPYNHCVCECPTPICHQSDFLGYIHFGSAALFFVAMGYLSVFHFTRGPAELKKAKKQRNVIYRVCGIGMWAILGLTGIAILAGCDESFEHIILWAEIMLLVLFGMSWLVKGKALVAMGIQKED